MKLGTNPEEQKPFDNLAFPKDPSMEYVPVREEDEKFYVSEPTDSEISQEDMPAKELFKDRALEDMSEDEITLLFDESFAELLDYVRTTSEAGQLIVLKDIADQGIIPKQFSEESYEVRVLDYLADIELSSELEFDDITTLVGKENRYYFSTRYQSSSWAKAMFLSRENDDRLSFVTTVRDESEIYPRPMIISSLENEPYSYTHARIEEIFDEIADMEEYADIKEVYASNGDRYFYSNNFLSHAQALALAEYYSVERFYNA